MKIFTIEKANGIAVISMNDPSQAQNVLNKVIQEEFESVFEQVSNDKELKGLIFKSHKPKCFCLLYTSPSPRDLSTSRMPSSA